MELTVPEVQSFHLQLVCFRRLHQCMFSLHGSQTVNKRWKLYPSAGSVNLESFSL